MGNHWYDKHGNSCHTQITAKGKIRDTTIRDARKLGLFPSVTTILQILDKPALTNWKIRNAVLAGEKAPRFPGETDQSLVNRANKVARQIAEDAAQRGTEIHDALESWCEGRGYPSQFREHVLATKAQLLDAVPDWGEHEKVVEQACVGPGYAGRCDLQVPGAMVIADYKTKDFDESKLASIKGYPDQGMQLAAYAYATGLFERATPDRPVRLINIFVSRDNPGLATWYEHKDPVRLGNAFLALVRYWHHRNTGLFDPEEVPTCVL